jgi:sec-independent protein translocase protein TatC
MNESEILTSIWDHIADLRKTIIRVMIIIGCGFIATLAVHQSIFGLLTMSYQLEEQGMRQTLQHERIINTESYPIFYTVPREAQVLSSQGTEALSNGVYRLFPGASLDYEVMAKSHLLILGPLEGINITFKVCFWLSLALTSPFWGWTLLQFIIPGLRQEEKVLILPFLIGSVFCLLGGVALANFVTLPMANVYLNAFNASIGQNAWSLGHYIDYTLVLFMGHAVAFELGLILFVLVHLGCISAEWLIGKRRYMIVLAFVLGAVLTPPDILTQVMLAVPLMILYELAILYGKSRALKKDKKKVSLLS